MSSSIIVFSMFGIFLCACALALVVVPLFRKREGQQNAPAAAIVTAVTLPVVAFMFYVTVSNFDWTAPQRQAAPQASSAGEATSLPDAVKSLEARLAESPEDVGGWLLLGRTYMQLQRLPDARRAFAAAYQLEPSNDAKLALAEIDIIQDRANLGGQAGLAVEQVLAEEPDNQKALFYGGMAAMLRGENELVMTRWQKLLAMSPPEPIRDILEEQLEQLDGAAPVAEPLAPVGDGIAVSVAIADELRDQVGANAVLFLLARQPNVPGPPIAAVRASARELPTSLRISDDNAMVAGRTLSDLQEVELVARVSNGGGPIAASGDLFGEVIWNAADTSNASVDIVIDQIVE
ncbi:MAG: tetratricopeptide repeat protein [Gammaproteobacteria bacterium]